MLVILVVGLAGGGVAGAAWFFDKRAAARSQANRAVAHKACAAAYTPAIEAAGAMSSRVIASLTIDDHRTALQEIQVAYDRARVRSLSAACDAVRSEVERTLREFAAAQTVWDACQFELQCEFADIQSKMDEHWDAADSARLRAQSHLVAIRTSG